MSQDILPSEDEEAIGLGVFYLLNNDYVFGKVIDVKVGHYMD